MSVIRATPTARILYAIRNRDWSVWSALYELIDNSFGELRGNAKHVWIFWNPKRRVLQVLDNGRGMDDVGDLFIPGKGTAAGAGDNGLYGVGGTEAGIWLADAERVETIREGMVAAVNVNWQRCVERAEFPVFSNSWHDVTGKNSNPILRSHGHGTLITLRLKDGLRIVPEDLQRYLSRTFAAGLRHGRSITWLQDGGEAKSDEITLEPWNPGEFDDVIDTTVTLSNGLSAHVRAGTVTSLSIANSKLSVTYLYRQIKETSEGFGRPMQGICGYVDLSAGWLEHLTTTKDNFRESSRHLEQELMAAIQVVLKPLLDRLEQARMEKLFTNVKFKLATTIRQGIATVRREHGRSSSGLPNPQANPDAPPRPPKSKLGPEGDQADDDSAATIVEIQPLPDDQMRKLLCHVELTERTAKGFINKDHPLIVEAMKAEPVNELLLTTILVQALAAEIVAKQALVRFGLFSQAMADEIYARFDGNDYQVALYVIRLLTDGVVRKTA